MCIKKFILSKWAVITFLVVSAVSITLWAQNQHESVEMKCQARIDLACEKIDQIYAPKSKVDVIEAILLRLEDKVDRLLLRSKDSE